NPLNSNDQKDSLIALSANFWCILDEYGKMRASEQNWYKSAMSKDLIKVRIPYDPSPITVKRLANFIGSTNETDFLDDPTGSVRWICFELANVCNGFAIDFNYSKNIDVHQLWAQAYAMYNDGAEYKMTRDEQLENESINNHFRAISTEMEYVARYYAPLSEEQGGEFKTSADILTELIRKEDIPQEVRRNLNVISVGKAMTFFRFPRSSKYIPEIAYTKKGYYVGAPKLTFNQNNN
ncbi:MAG: VapE domain-containing protein, partial [Bacteroidales bacterium]